MYFWTRNPKKYQKDPIMPVLGLTGGLYFQAKFLWSKEDLTRIKNMNILGGHK